MRRLVLPSLLAAIAGAMLLAGTAAAQTPERLYVVVHAENRTDRLDKGMLKNMYLGKVTFWTNELRVRAYNRPTSGSAGKLFFKSVLSMTPSRYRHHWQRLKLSGMASEPETISSAASLIATIATSPGAVGYIVDSERRFVDARVRLIPIN